MSFRFPPSFEKTHPEAMKNLRTNAQRLSTPFDVHATFLDVLDYSGVLRGDVKQVSRPGTSVALSVLEVVSVACG